MFGRIAAAVLLSALAFPAIAGHIYRCENADGVTSYTSKRLSGTRCKKVSSYTPTRAHTAKRPVSTAPAPVLAAVPAPSAKPDTQVDTKPKTPVSLAPLPAPMATQGPRVMRGQVYAFVDKNGVRNYTSVRPAGLPASSVRTIQYSYIERCYACGALPGVNFGSLRLNTTAYQDEIRTAAKEHGVEEAIVRAIIHAESSYNPMALSRAGAQGLMQLMPGTASRFGVSNAFDATQNIRGGVKYLAWLLKRFNGNLTLAAAGYNAGEGAVDKYGGVPPYSETQRYVQRVAVLADRYRGALNPMASPLRNGLSAR